MKSIKRIIALLLTAVMTMTMSVTAFAVDSSCSLTVNVNKGQDLKEQTINLYKLFDVTTSQSGNKTNYAYTVNDTYKETLAATLELDGTATNEALVNKVSKLDTGAVQKFANDFTATALTEKLGATETSGKIGTSKNSYEFKNLKPGYYLVYVTGGKEIQSSLVTVDGTNEVKLKTEAPSITKTANTDTVSIGQVVKYTVTGSVPDTTGYSEYVYKIHDTLSNGLDFVNDKNGTATSEGKVNVTVAFKEAGVTAGGTTPTTATLDTTNKTMSLDLSVWVRANQTNKGKEFTVTYYAKVNNKAVVEEKNKAELVYGNNPSDTTTTKPSEVKTPTYYLNINKYAKNDSKKLAGAKFKLYKDSVDENNVIKVTGSEGNYVVDPASTTTEFVSVDSITSEGYNLHVNGLAAGTYYLVETKAPAGYNKLTDPIKVEIKKSTNEAVNAWTLFNNDKNVDDKIIDVENSTGSILPSTGGMGTIAFTVVATLLVLGVAVSFIRDRKKEN
ncbi:SpaH/EbpB family LPXTG-anchored major pilin [Catenibacterium mitsuokai]|uniref:SpaH/EbpB family LPXTG-anchored major pilin n=1 Tax=Catenibacterium mitsuokai TaxID=100886 RepID=UPI001C2420B0|nr:SpaH/EbpB family LPXTG-anchored major pilin [Catenibacterium mitsuokai]MBU9056553.1 SpaH/EbpB family LPXTG-anchored major pilin [Catenibacterium mitsuokai]MCB5427204.1 SpaH/EbpB family LPXTG-anchored major pilin [Catenibacterium mitsuokai]